MRKTASIIIVNYNGRHLLQECLDSLYEQTLRDFEVILVDNASADDSLDLVLKHYPEVKVIQNRENLGYGGGNNKGIRESSGTYIVLLNNDTKADPRWLENLVKTAEGDADAGMCASKIMNYDHPDIIDNTGLLLYRDGIGRGRGRLERDKGSYAMKDEVMLPSGCAGLYRREMFDEIGLFDEDFFLYLDDVDIGLRGRLAGWKCLYVPGAVVYHKYSMTTKPYSPLKAYLVERNRIWVVIKYFPLSMALLSLFHTFLRYIMQAYGILAGKGAGSCMVKSGSAFGSIRIVFKAYWNALSKFHIMIGKRQDLKRLKKVDNREIRSWFRRFGISVAEVALKE